MNQIDQMYYYSATTTTPSITETLGLNLTSLILYGLAFLVTVAILNKYVWPPLTNVLDAKRGELEAASRLEIEAKDLLHRAELDAKKILTSARKTADDVIFSAKNEATAMVQAAEAKAQAQADTILADANTQLTHQVREARQTLAHETARLVARATSAILEEKLDKTTDAALIERGLKRAENVS
jgi:F-type H+-transporting ATPase subunit b